MIVFHCVMQARHPMIGADIHIPCPTPPLPPVGVYLTLSTLEGMWASVSTKGPEHKSESGLVMCRNTDIGPTIHIPVILGGVPYPLLAVEILCAASKSFFGPQAFQQADGTGAPKPVCAAVLGPSNYNMNCCKPVNLPVGLAVAWTTYVTGMTFADFVSGVIQAGIDTAIQWGIGKVIGRVDGATSLASKGGAWAAQRLGPVMLRSVINPLTRLASRVTAPLAGRMGGLAAAAGSVRQSAAGFIGRHGDELSEAGEAGLGFLFGSPYGASVGNLNDAGWSPYGALSGAGGSAVGMGDNETTGDYLTRQMLGRDVPVHPGE